MNNKPAHFIAAITRPIAVIGIGLILVGCSSATQSNSPTAQSTASIPTTAPTVNGSTAATTQGNATVTPAAKQACALLTAATIKTITGLDFAQGTPTPSTINGSSCDFKSAKQEDQSTDLLLQVGIGKDFYPYTYFTPDPSVQSAGVGDQSYILGAGSRSPNAGAVKGNVVVMISMNIPMPLTTDQVKALLKAVIDQW